jgi:hypothetical protein
MNTNFAIIVISQGADWLQQLVIENDDGTPVNLTGCGVHMQVRAWPGATTVLLDLSTAASTITITNPAAGQINFDVPGAQTALFVPALNRPIGEWPIGTELFGYYDVRVQFPNEQIFTYMFGRVYMRPGVTIPF